MFFNKIIFLQDLNTNITWILISQLVLNISNILCKLWYWTSRTYYTIFSLHTYMWNSLKKIANIPSVVIVVILLNKINLFLLKHRLEMTLYLKMIANSLIIQLVLKRVEACRVKCHPCSKWIIQFYICKNFLLSAYLLKLSYQYILISDFTLCLYLYLGRV